MSQQIIFGNNAKSTLAGAISNVATVVTLAPGTGALFPAPGAGQFYVATLTDAATGLLNEIIHVTGMTGDVATIVRAQEGTTAQSWNAGDLIGNRATAGQMAAFQQVTSTRSKFSGDTSFYVSITGDDTTGDGSFGSPWRTMQHAVNVVQQGYDLSGYQLTFVRKDSLAYTDPTAVFGLFVGQISPVLFSASAMANVTVTCATAACYVSDGGANITVQNQKLVATVNNILYATHSSSLTHQLNNFGLAGSSQIVADRGGQIRAIGPYTISGGASSHISVSTGANSDTGVLATLTGTPAFSGAFATALDCGVVNAIGMTFTGTGTGVRYSATLNAVINTGGGGAAFFPTGTGGTTATGGQYA